MDVTQTVRDVSAGSLSGQDLGRKARSLALSLQTVLNALDGPVFLPCGPPILNRLAAVREVQKWKTVNNVRLDGIDSDRTRRGLPSSSHEVRCMSCPCFKAFKTKGLSFSCILQESQTLNKGQSVRQEGLKAKRKEPNAAFNRIGERFERD